MSDWGMGLALQGLYGRQQKVDRNKEELATLQSLKKEKEADEDKEQQSQMQKAAYDKQVSDFSDKLLGPDRDKINQKAKILQSRVREELKNYGGDMSKFMANGGHTFLNDYKTSLLSSPESTNYLDNKSNMDKLVSIQMSGKGHLINQNDLFSMKEYNKNGGGKVNFTGMLNEIQMPDANSYDYNTEIPSEDILDKNHVAIYGNYITSHPDNPNPSRQDLLAFTKMNYGGKGANWQRQNEINKQKEDMAYKMEKMRLDHIADLVRAQNVGKKTKMVTGTDGKQVEVYDDGVTDPGDKNYTRLITGEVYRAINERGMGNVTAEEFFNNSAIPENSPMNSIFEDFDPKELVSADLDLTEEKVLDFGKTGDRKNSFMYDVESAIVNKYIPSNAKRIKGLDIHKQAVAMNIFKLSPEQFDQANLEIKDFTISDDMFHVNGQQIGTSEDHIDREAYKGNWTVRNVMLGAVANTPSGKVIVMDRVDKEGKEHSKNKSEREAKYGKDGNGLRNINANQLIIQLEDKNGQNFYKAVEYTSELAQSLNVDLKDKNQLKETDVEYGSQQKNKMFKVNQSKQDYARTKASWDYLEREGKNAFSGATEEAVRLGGSYNQSVVNLSKSYYVATSLLNNQDKRNLPNEIRGLIESPNENLTAVIAEYQQEGLDVNTMIKRGQSARDVIDAMINFDTKNGNNSNLSLLMSWKENLEVLNNYR